MDIEVSSISVRGGVVAVRFTDGHVAKFAESTGGFAGSVTTLERIWLDGPNRTTPAMYYSPHQYPITYRPFGFHTLAEGYSIRGVTAYFVAAYEAVAAAQRDGKHQDAWNIINKGYRDIEDLKAGRQPSRR